MRRSIAHSFVIVGLVRALAACGSTAGARQGGWTQGSPAPAGAAAQPVVAKTQPSPDASAHAAPAASPALATAASSCR